MTISNKNIGVALTGSFCTYERIFLQLIKLVEIGANVTTIFSNTAQNINCRFGNSSEFLINAEKITKNKPITTIEGAEPIGPKNYFDLLVIAPCTGNTVAKIAAGITDTPVLMACKSHIRNNKPVVIFLASNDALGFNLKNIGELLNTKNFYFVPFGQDDYKNKPKSMVSDSKLLIPTIENALEKRQIQPVIISCF